MYIESPVTLCSIHNVAFTDLALGLELNYINQNPGADVFTNTFSNCKVGIKTHSSNNINLTLCTLTENISGGSIGILIQGGYGITLSNTLVQQFETGAQLSLCNGFYLTSASKIYDTHKGIIGTNSSVFIRNGGKVELTLTAGVELTGTYTTTPYPHYTSMLTMGDQGCGNVVDCYGDCITGSNFILNIDPIIHDGNDGDNNPSYNPNWISRNSGGSGKYFNICYDHIGNPSHAPTLIYARKNFWVPYSTTNTAPTTSNVFIGSTTGSSCFNSNVARSYTPMTQCATPSTYDCMYCQGTLKSEGDPDGSGENETTAASIVMNAYENANEDFLIEDAPDTRQQFDDVSALELNFDTLNNQWNITTLAGIILATDDSTAQRIMAAKVIYADDDSSTNQKLSPYETAEDIFTDYYAELLIQNSTTKTEAENDMAIYPNPAQGKVNIYFKSYEFEKQVQLTNLCGVEIKRTTITNSGSINLETIPQGIYLLKATNLNDGRVEVRRLVVE